jgi:hypothetical protein
MNFSPVLVDQIAALAAHAFGNQAAHFRDAGRVELPELHVFQRQPGAQHHAETVAGIDVGVGGMAKDAAGAAGGQQRGARLEQARLAGLDLQRHHAQHIAFFVADQVQREELVEELRARGDVALVQRVQQRMAGAVGGGAGADGLLAAVVLRLAAKRALVDLAVFQARERQAHVLQFVHRAGCIAAHELDGVLVAQVIRSLHGVIHVPVPVVIRHVGQRRRDAALRRHGMRTGWEDLGNQRHFQVGLRQLQRGAQTGATAADDDRIECPLRNLR